MCCISLFTPKRQLKKIIPLQIEMTHQPESLDFWCGRIIQPIYVYCVTVTHWRPIQRCRRHAQYGLQPRETLFATTACLRRQQFPNNF